MASIRVADLDPKKGFVTIRVGSVYIQFQNVKGKLKYNNKWKHSRAGCLYVPSGDFSKARKKAAEALSLQRKKAKPKAKQLSLDLF